MAHISGNPWPLFKLVFQNLPISYKRIPLLGLYFVKLLVLLPFGVIEYIWYSKKIKQTPITQAPIFIIGHYRSGTTFLHQLLALDGQFGYFTNVDTLFPYLPHWLEKRVKKYLQWMADKLQVEYFHLNKVKLQVNDPMEEDMCMISHGLSHSAYWGYLFASKAAYYLDRFIFFNHEKDKQAWKESYLYQLKKMTLKCGGKQLILKNPPNTGRIRTLLEMFPQARFIYLHRHPYQIFYSMQGLWNHTIEKYYSLQVISCQQKEAVIFNHYLKLMRQYDQDKYLIPAGNLLQCRFEDLGLYPESEIKKIYHFFHLQNSEAVSYKIGQKLNTQQKYVKFNYTTSSETEEKINHYWKDYIERYQDVSPLSDTKHATFT